MRLSTRVIILASIFTVFLAGCPHHVAGRVHHLNLENDARRLVHITSFGFFKGGFMEVKVNDIYLDPAAKGNKKFVGFTVDRTLKGGINPYPHDTQSGCALTSRQSLDESTSTIRFALDFDKKSVEVECSPTLVRNVHVYKSSSSIPMSVQETKFNHFRNIMTQPQRRKRNGTAAIMGQTDYDASAFYLSADFNDSLTLSDGIGTGDADIELEQPQIADKEKSKDISNVGASQDTLSGSTKAKKPAVDETKMSNNNVEPKRLDSPVDREKQREEGVAQGEVPPEKITNLEADGGIPNRKVNNQAETNQERKSPDSSEETNGEEFIDPATETCSPPLKLNATTLPNGVTSYSFSFAVYIAGEGSEGIYNLYFHNCADGDGDESHVTLNVSMVEENLRKNYLSAGEMPLPALYFMMSILFFMAGCFWIFMLRKSKRETGVSVFKMHYIMGSLVFVKSFSLLFHSIFYHFIQVQGTHVEGWAVVYYVTHLLKGALLFIVILLIGTGYTFVKHLLSDKDKKIFMIVIPLQILANVAQIIIEESEEGEVVHTTWQVIFISVDLLCCCAILFPVVWSIRHLQEASQTDGKAASNLKKLKLFRHFYIIVVCYIYFTRIIIQMLLKITVPFQYEWLDNMFLEMTTFIFYVLTGYKFRPAANNPYLKLAHDSEDEEMDTVITDSGLTEGAVKRGYKPKKKTLKEIVLYDPNEEETDDDEEVLLEKRREASHDLD